MCEQKNLYVKEIQKTFELKILEVSSNPKDGPTRRPAPGSRYDHIRKSRVCSVLTGLVVCSAVLFVGGHAGAATITVGFEGAISSSGSFSDPTGNFSQGELLSGIWTLDTATADADPASSRGVYAQSGAPAFEINIGSHSFETNTMTIQILDNHTLGLGTIDAYDVLGSSATSTVAGLTVDQMQITLRDTMVPLDALSSDAIPSMAPNPLSFDQGGQASGQITGKFGASNDRFFLNLNITSTRTVPEPGSSALFILGLGALALRRRWS